MMDVIKTLVFDLDGVITSEKKYWNTSRLTAWELICDRDFLGLNDYFGNSEDVNTRLLEVGDNIISQSFIYELKSRAINSNWDLTFFVVCLHLVSILERAKDEQETRLFSILKNNSFSLKQQLQELGKLLINNQYNSSLSEKIIAEFWIETKFKTGASVLDYVNVFITDKLGSSFTLFDPRGELWELCYQNFQAWYEGRKGYNLPDDETVIEVKDIEKTLKTLLDSGKYTLAIATGRPRNEVINPLTVLGLLTYFDASRIVTYDDVIAAESLNSNQIKLGKPHPFILYKAIYPHEAIINLCQDDFQVSNAETIAYIGDAGSDVVAAKKAGVFSIGVLTGFAEGKAREEKGVMLKNLGCDVVLDSILELPQLLGIK